MNKLLLSIEMVDWQNFTSKFIEIYNDMQKYFG